MTPSFTDQWIADLLRDILAITPEDKRPEIEPRLRQLFADKVEPAREILDQAAERFASQRR